MAITPKELNTILDLHRKWLYTEPGGERADLYEADLCRADLRRANLRRANLRRANLRRANLSGADLSGAYLCGADLSGADLSGADLYGADLCGANLYEADLCRADLSGADLYGANLSGANLYEADLCRANLSGANLYGAKNSEYAEALTVICPEGEIVGWKKALGPDGNVIVKLVIPKSAKRCNAMGRKCRASKAKVVRIEDMDGNKLDCIARSFYCQSFEYRVGDTITPVEPFNDDRWDECSSGIHFFITREEAVNYSF